MLAPKLRQTLQLPCGRTLGFAEYGAAAGRAVMYLHGTPSSRLEVGTWDAFCVEQNVRLIAPDRPGLGRSSFHTERTVATYPADIAALAAHLGWRRFHLLGGSGGAPYVLACARFLPPEKLGAVGVIAGSGPPEAGSAGLSLLARAAQPLFRRPRLMAWLLKHEAQCANDADPDKLARRLRKMFAVLSPADRAACEQDWECIVAGTRESYRQGPDGPAWDLYHMMQPWGFELADIPLRDKLVFWCGTQDRNTPLAMSRYMAAHVPGARLVEIPGLTHYTIFLEEYVRRIVDELLAGEDA